MENKEQIRLTIPAASPYALSMAGEPGASENLVSSHSTARKGAGTVATRYESGIVNEVNGEVHVNQERLQRLKNARLIQKIKKYLDRAFNDDGIPKDKHEREKYFADMVREWSTDAVKEVVEAQQLSDDVGKIRRDMVRIVYDKAKKEKIDLKEHFKNEAELLELIEHIDTRDELIQTQQAHQASEAVATNGHETLHQAQTETTLHQRRAPENLTERAAYLRLPQNLMAVPAPGDAATTDLLNSYDQMVNQSDPAWLQANHIDPENRIQIGSRDIDRMIRLLEDRLGNQPPAGFDLGVRQHILEVQAALRQRMNALSGSEIDQGDREALTIIGRVKNEQGEPIKIQEIIVDSRRRGQVYNDLFAAVDATPHDFWQQAWNPLTQGARYEAFMEYIRSLSQANRTELEHEVGKEFLVQYLKNRRATFQEQGVLVDQINTVADYDNNNVLPAAQKDLLARLLTQELRNDHYQFQRERQAREILHNANAILYRTDINPEQLFGFIKQFGDDLGDMAHRFQGVRQMMEIYEEQLRMAMAEHHGYLRPEDVLGTTQTETRVEQGQQVKVHVREKKSRIEERAKQIFLERYNRGMIFVRDEEGRSVDMRHANGGQPLQPWEVERIMTIARGMEIASERLLSLAAESKLTTASQINQYFLQDILYAYSYFVHMDVKYWVPGPKPTGALIFDPGVEKWGPGFDLWLKPHNVANMAHLHHAYKQSSVGFMETHDLAQLNRQNPNHCGDLFTWLSGWRVGETLSGNESITRDFMRRGWEFMINEHYLAQNPNASADYTQLRQAHQIQGAVTSREFYIRHDDVHYEPPEGQGHGNHAQEPTLENIIATNLYIYLHGGNGFNEGTADAIHELREHLNEYAKWIGTGLRFEKMRANLEHIDAKDDAKRTKARGHVEAAMNLLEHIVDFQPDKIFLKSRKIQDRVMPHLREEWGGLTYIPPGGGAPIVVSENGVFSEERFQEVLRSVMTDLEFMQNTVYKNRDHILRNGRHFDEIKYLENGNVVYDLNLVYDPNTQTMPDLPAPNPNDAQLYPQGVNDPTYIKDLEVYEGIRIQREQMRNHIAQQLNDPDSPLRQFIEKMRADWNEHHGDINSKEGAKAGKPTYLEEFIRYREYYHGFVLWSGDAPLDEFHMTAIGQTGGFTMRAGNNMDNAKAAMAGNELLSHLKDFKKPEDAIAALTEIYKPIQNYDLDRAQEVMGYWVDAVLKVYGADWQSWMPLWGGFQKWRGKESFIQTWYGKRMPVWQAAEKRHFLDLLKERGLITPEKYKELIPLARARNWFEVPVDKLNYPLQLLLLATALYIAKETFGED